MSDPPLVVSALRTAIVLFAVYVGLRVFGRRHTGEVHVGDILLILLLANSVQNAMTSGSGRLSVALVSAASLLSAGWAAGVIFRHIPGAERRVEGGPILLVHDGTIVRRNLKREHLTEEELMGLVRKQGLDRLSDVRLAVLEPNGAVTVVKRESSKPKQE